MNLSFAFDLCALIVVGLFTVSGFRFGLIVSIYDLIVLAITAVLVVQLGSVDFTTVGLSPGRVDDKLRWLGFVVILLLGESLRLLGSRAIQHGRQLLILTNSTSDYVDHVLGIVAGAARGAIYVVLIGTLIVGAAASTTFVLTPGLNSIFGTMSDAVHQSIVAGPVTSLADVPATEVSSLSTTGSISTSSEQLALIPDLAPVEDAAAEADMLRMINLTRLQAGVGPLIGDASLSRLAWGHSEEMVRLAYFAHDSPVKGNVSSRYEANGIRYTVLGENLAYAPSIVSAFNGLLESPLHRQNLLSVEFRRVGIGVAQGRSAWFMVTQDFSD